MRIVLRGNLGAVQILARLKELIGDDVMPVDDDDSLSAALPEAEALLIPDSLYSGELARLLRDRAKKLRWIQLLSAGYDAVMRHGIPDGVLLTNAGDAYGPPVATQAIALLLAVQRQFPALLDNQKRHVWDRTAASRCAIPLGGTAAVIGFGHIGSEIGRLLQAFGARTIAVTRRAKPHPAADEAASVAQLHAILPRADAVMIALAAGPETRHLIGAAEFALMKRNAVLVNIARGYVVDSHALAQALRDGTIAGAGIDVTDPEPLPATHELWDAPNLIIAPHMAGASGPVMGARLAKVVGENVARFLAGEAPAHLVSP